MGQEMLTLSGTPAFTPFGEFIISHIHYINITDWDYAYGLMTELFFRTSLMALSWTCVMEFHVSCMMYAMYYHCMCLWCGHC